MTEPSTQAARRVRTFYPFPEDCEACQEGLEGPHREPCETHAHLAEPDCDSGHKQS